MSRSSAPKRPSARFDAAWRAAERHLTVRLWRRDDWRKVITDCLYGGVTVDEMLAVIAEVVPLIEAGELSRHRAWRTVARMLRHLAAESLTQETKEA